MAIPEKPITRQEMYLDAIAKAGGGGGSALPSVTTADNGKVLSVVDGAWAADVNRFVVTCTPDENDAQQFSIDKTYNEITAAWESGKTICLKFTEQFELVVTNHIYLHGPYISTCAHPGLDVGDPDMLIVAQILYGELIPGRLSIYQLTQMGS